MQKIIVADTSCLILFYKIGELELLHRVFGQIIITEVVSIEFGRPLPYWFLIKNPKSNIYSGLLGTLDAGEATSISLATEYKECLLIIDELKGRTVAKELRLKISGSLGVLVTAKSKGVINSVKPILNKIRQTDFRISDELIQKALILANENK